MTKGTDALKFFVILLLGSIIDGELYHYNIDKRYIEQKYYI